MSTHTGPLWAHQVTDFSPPRLQFKSPGTPVSSRQSPPGGPYERQPPPVAPFGPQQHPGVPFGPQPHPSVPFGPSPQLGVPFGPPPQPGVPFGPPPQPGVPFGPPPQPGDRRSPDIPYGPQPHPRIIPPNIPNGPRPGYSPPDIGPPFRPPPQGPMSPGIPVNGPSHRSRRESFSSSSSSSSGYLSGEDFEDFPQGLITRIRRDARKRRHKGKPARRHKPRRRKWPKDIDVPPEGWNGSEKERRRHAYFWCGDCDGTGKEVDRIVNPGENVRTCRTCWGRGSHWRHRNWFKRFLQGPPRPVGPWLYWYLTLYLNV
ncbi:hypothetical protein V8F20_004803 [Naviculisporaceae sp. PSN 640]